MKFSEQYEQILENKKDKLKPGYVLNYYGKPEKTWKPHSSEQFKQGMKVILNYSGQPAGTPWTGESPDFLKIMKKYDQQEAEILSISDGYAKIKFKDGNETDFINIDLLKIRK